MFRRIAIGLMLCFSAAHPFAQTPAEGNFNLALPDHSGRLKLSAPGFEMMETSAKAQGNEIGFRAQNASLKVSFLVFLFKVFDDKSLTGEKCRDGVMKGIKKQNPTLEIRRNSELDHPGGPPVFLLDYTTKGRDGKLIYSARGFVASGDICGDLEVYGDSKVSFEADELKSVFASYQLDEKYIPGFKDIFLYAQILYNHHMFQEAAPLYELALSKVTDTPEMSAKNWRRVTTDQAGMAYGISGNISKARDIFQKALAEDPDYPLYYYNLACADAEENKLADAKKNLRAAFDRKANVIPNEKLPDPSQDDSFLPHKNDKEFWSFVEGLEN